MNIIQTDSGMTDEQRSKIIFAGDLIVFQQLPAMLELCQYTDQLLSESLNGLYPEQAQYHLSEQDYRRFVADTQKRIQADDKAKAMFFHALQEAGLALDSTYYDYFAMRVVSAEKTFTEGLRTVVGHHRDTWGSNIQAQTNWWAPIYKIEEERSIAFYPDHWEHPTLNDTAQWSFKEYLAARRETPEGVAVSYSPAPQLLRPVDESKAVKIVIEPGDILCFSSAHLHASVPNTTKLARFSVEMRTLNLTDLDVGRGAPNVDNAGGNPQYQWYRHTVDQSPLSMALASV
ncbi:hypothetical protein Q4508_13070 [Amphritea sp. 2_MG-2023]|uniref:hypothetical protein n=1 Tax=Amphritea TaxID=515417 RepID=UPI001C07628D|nr:MULTISPECIES: hypothetical protein [Amphritea]MBU2964259.1 hypothetical protein [Amphritea atlantica]MDO6419483.1 hypothetical protein [Amphritea sp. 2_MG-2023]